jgi:hypothetical protein
VVLVAISVYLVIAGAVNGWVSAVIIGAVIFVLEVGLIVLVLLAFRPSRWPGEPDELIAQAADAVVARLDSPWRYSLESRDGFGVTGTPVAAFSRESVAGPVLWFENPTTFRVTYVLPDGDEMSAELWRNSAGDHERLVDILVSLCDGRLTRDGHYVFVETAKRPIKLPVYPDAALRRAREGFED